MSKVVGVTLVWLVRSGSLVRPLGSRTGFACSSARHSLRVRLFVPSTIAIVGVGLLIVSRPSLRIEHLKQIDTIVTHFATTNIFLMTNKIIIFFMLSSFVCVLVHPIQTNRPV